MYRNNHIFCNDTKRASTPFQDGAHTVAELSRATGATYASAHEAAARLSARGIVEPLAGDGRRGLALPASIERWIEAFPPAREAGAV